MPLPKTSPKHRGVVGLGSGFSTGRPHLGEKEVDDLLLVPDDRLHQSCVPLGVLGVDIGVMAPDQHRRALDPAVTA